MLNKVIIAEVQNGKLKVAMNIVHILSIVHCVFWADCAHEWLQYR